MKIKHVWKLNDCEWWAGDTLENTIKQAMFDTGLEKDEVVDMPQIVSLDEKMLYSINADDLKTYLYDNKDKKYEIRNDPTGCEDFALTLSFREVLEIDKPTKPYPIACTEF